MSGQREQLNEMKKFRQLMEDIDNACEQCGRTDCKCEPGTCECEPVNESETDRPYICVHAKHGKYECDAPTSYEAVRRAAIHWGMRDTVGVSAHLADIKHSTQFVGEGEMDEGVGDWVRDKLDLPPKDLIEPELTPSSARESWAAASTKSILEHLNEWRFKVENGSARFDSRRMKDLKTEIKIMEYELKKRGVDPTEADTIFESDPDDTDWDAHWAREDGDDERADDLEADAEFARMDNELDENDSEGKEFIDDYESKTADNNPCMYCDSKDDDCEVCHGKDEMFEDSSEYRLAEIIGKDGLTELIKDLRNGQIEEYNNNYFEKLYFHFLDEYPDEIPVGHRTGRPDNPDEYVMDSLVRYHEAEIENYIKQDIQANPIGLGEVGEVMHDDYGAAPVYEGAECDACYGLGRKPSGGADCEECGGSGTCPKLNEDFIPLGEALTQLAQAFGILIAIAAAGLYSIDSIDNPGRMRKLFRTIRQRFNLTPQDFKTSKLIDRVYRQDPDFKALVDKYMKPDGSFKSAGYSKIIDYLREKGVGDVEHFIYKLRGFRQNNPVESINLESIVEAVLNQPRDYEMSDDEMSDLGAAAQSKSSIVKDMGDELGVDVVDMPMSDFEDDFIDPEYEDSELGLRFD